MLSFAAAAILAVLAAGSIDSKTSSSSSSNSDSAIKEQAAKAETYGFVEAPKVDGTNLTAIATVGASLLPDRPSPKVSIDIMHICFKIFNFASSSQVSKSLSKGDAD